MVRATCQSGMRNLGNTCFMNSALQCLLHLPDLNAYINARQYINSINFVNRACKGRLIIEYLQLVERALCGENKGTLNPSAIKDTIKRYCSTFAGYSQQDAQEFLSFFLDALHEDLNSVLRKEYIALKDYDGGPVEAAAAEAWEAHLRRNNSRIIDLFFGQFYTRIVCPTCNHLSLTFDPFEMLGLNIPTQEEFCNYFVPLTTQDSIIDVKYQTCGSQLVEDAIADLNKKKLNKQDSVIVGRYRFHSMIDRTEPDPNRTTVSKTIESKFIFFLDEIYDPQYHEMIFGARASTLLQRIRARTAKNFTYIVYLENEKKSIERELPLPDDTTLAEFNLFMYIINRNALIETKKLPAEFQNTSFVFEKSIYEKELALLFPKGAFSEEVSPYQLKLGQRLVEKYDSSEPLFESGEKDKIEISVLLNSSLIKSIKLKSQGGNIQLANKSAYTLTDCLRLFVQPEVLDKDNQWYCSKCAKHQSAQRQMMLYKLPNILIIHLKRFKKDLSRVSFKKNQNFVDFPLDGLDMGPYMYGQDQKALYNLMGVSNHLGMMGGGHYFSYCRDSPKSSEWKAYDDEEVRPVSEDRVVSEAAYILFYVRQI